MQNKGVKSVFKLINGFYYGQFTLGPSCGVVSEHYDFDIKHFFSLSIKESDFKSFRVVVGDIVFEAHRDKHNNIIYREYEKKK